MTRRQPFGCPLVLIVLVLSWFTPAVSAATSEPEEASEPSLVAVVAPAEFDLSNLAELRMLVGVELSDVSPMDEAEIFFEVFGPSGEPLEIPVIGTLTAREALLRDRVVGLDMAFAQEYRGESFAVKICAYSNLLAGNPCAVVELFDKGSPLDEHPKSAKQTAELLKKRFPGIGCRCKKGQIRHSPTQTSHGSLGSFTDKTGGAKYGPHSNTDLKNQLINSNFKFEAHFEIEILNPPAKPKGFDAHKWSATTDMFPVLCTEGQRINGAHHFTDKDTGKPVEFPFKETVAGKTVTYPYKKSTDEKAFKWDGHGYRAPGTGARTVKGNVKAHDKNIIHWLDSPGLNQKAMTSLLKVAPTKMDIYFHTFVHGSTGKASDNCDCFHGVTTGIVDNMGVTGQPAMISKPVCK